jgi:hypothetical protein
MKAIEAPSLQQVRKYQGLTQEQIQQRTDVLVTRRQLASRWNCAVETIKRRQRQGIITAVRLSPRQVRYSLLEIIRIEEAAK